MPYIIILAILSIVGTIVFGVFGVFLRWLMALSWCVPE